LQVRSGSLVSLPSSRLQRGERREEREVRRVSRDERKEERGLTSLSRADRMASLMTPGRETGLLGW
jgi:hypothetical protein